MSISQTSSPHHSNSLTLTLTLKLKLLQGFALKIYHGITPILSISIENPTVLLNPMKIWSVLSRESHFFINTKIENHEHD